jgi:hypothetical protein
MPAVGLVDEVRMLVCPVSRGKGTRVWDRQDLRVAEAADFDNGAGVSAARDQEIRGRPRTFDSSWIAGHPADIPIGLDFWATARNSDGAN